MITLLDYLVEAQKALSESDPDNRGPHTLQVRREITTYVAGDRSSPHLYSRAEAWLELGQISGALATIELTEEDETLYVMEVKPAQTALYWMGAALVEPLKTGEGTDDALTLRPEEAFVKEEA